MIKRTYSYTIQAGRLEVTGEVEAESMAEALAAAEASRTGLAAIQEARIVGLKERQAKAAAKRKAPAGWGVVEV